MSWKQWLALLLLFLAYLVIGGIIFMFIESPEEEFRLNELHSLREVIYDKLVYCKTSVSGIDLSEREDIWSQIAEQINQPILIKNHSDTPKKWTFYNSFFVAITVASTIGYGHLAPSSTIGRMFCIIFALVGIPINGILFASLGDFFSTKLAYHSSRRSLRRFSTFFVVLADAILYFIPGLIVFLAIPAGLFTYVEGWDYADSFYYAFISLTTIGFGDLVAGQSDIGYLTWIYRAFIIVWIFFGLGYLIMVMNIITRSFRSKPVVALEKRMAARIRATRKLLAKDSIALRNLVNQLRILKVKNIYQTDSAERYCVSSLPPVICNKEGNLERHVEPYKNDNGLNNNEFTLNCKSSKEIEADGNLTEDPVELLARLASILCEDSKEDDVSSDSESSSMEHSNTEEQKTLMEAAINRIRRSLRLSVQSRASSFSSPPFRLPDLHRGSTRRPSIPNIRRTRHVSECLSAVVVEDNPNTKHNQSSVVKTETEKPNWRSYKRSLSESHSSQKTSKVSSFDYSSSIEQPQLKDPSDTNRCTPSETDSMPVPSVAEFCDILDRVQISHQNNAV